MKEIVLAGGCFWGVEAYFQKLKGIVNTKVGYAQGFDENPIYNNVKKELTGHAEVCLIEYQETVISLTKILEHYFKIINPTSINKQGEDRGSQYRTGIYYVDEKDYLIIINFIENEQQNYRDKIAIEVEKLSKFYDAEEYHQNYLMKNPTGYCHINLNKIAKEDLK